MAFVFKTIHFMVKNILKFCTLAAMFTALIGIQRVDVKHPEFVNNKIAYISFGLAVLFTVIGIFIQIKYYKE